MHILEIAVLISASTSLISGAWVKEMENPGLYQGDMVLSPDQLNEVKKGTFGFGSISDRSKLWINGNGEAIVPYQIESSLASESVAKREIDAAIKEYHKYTCIRFVERTTEVNYVSFYQGKGCTSPVGKKYGPSVNRISLAKACWWRSIIIHEIAHSLGLHHEQSRPDRDNHVTILFDKINNGTEHNFKKADGNAVNSLGTPYDYLSIMHYAWNAFGKDQTTMTIKTKDPKYQYMIGQDEGFSEIDVKQLNLLYRCTGSFPKPIKFILPPTGCHDLGPGCGKSRFQGRCKNFRWRLLLREACTYSCGFCGNKEPRPTEGRVLVTPSTMVPSKTDSPTGECRDRVTDCQHLGRHRCNDKSKAWRKHMQKSCKRYCNLC